MSCVTILLWLIYLKCYFLVSFVRKMKLQILGQAWHVFTLWYFLIKIRMHQLVMIKSNAASKCCVDKKEKYDFNRHLKPQLDIVRSMHCVIAAIVAAVGNKYR